MSLEVRRETKGHQIRVMELADIRRIAADVISDYGPRCELIDVQQAGAVRGPAHIFPQDRYPFPREVIVQRWLDEIADPDLHVYVSADESGAITGFAASPGNIRHLPDRRRFDIGWFRGMILKPAGTKPLATDVSF